jgi:diacylglycerol kinase family enzyme
VLLEAMNTRSIGPNLVLAPDADLSDGRLDVVLVPKGAQDKLHRYLTDCQEGREGTLDLRVYKSRHLQMVWDGWTMHIDDDVWPDPDTELPRSPTVMDVQVYAESLWFLTPA